MEQPNNPYDAARSALSHIAQNQLDRIDLNKTIYESAIGRDLVEAANNLLADQAGFSDGVAPFDLRSARRISTSFRVLIEGHESEPWEIWEFEVFTHSHSLERLSCRFSPAVSHSRLAESQLPFRHRTLNRNVPAPGIRSGR